MDFDRADVARIESLEAAWLRRASRVYFSSTWALGEAVKSYALDPSSMRVAGMGGHVPIPSEDTYTGDGEFLFIALDFEGKGGRVCVEAFEQLRLEVPGACLRIVGERPPEDVLRVSGVVYEGLLNKSISGELERLQSLLGSAFALVHPTVRDATPQIIIEAQYHGCPVIAPRSFGIPEMVNDGVTGLLVNAPPRAVDVAERMLSLCRDPEGYTRMRGACRARALDEFTWEKVGDRIASDLEQLVA
jgi:glycosyltransferase involved in cell wall biosynthesis